MNELVERIAALQDYRVYEDLHWEGSFADYLELVRKNPRVARTAHERVYDMILTHGTEEYVDNKKKIVHYRFFDDEAHAGRSDVNQGLDLEPVAIELEKITVFRPDAVESVREVGEARAVHPVDDAAECGVAESTDPGDVDTATAFEKP